MDPVVNLQNTSSWRFGNNSGKASTLSTARELEGVFVGMVFEELAKGVRMGEDNSPAGQLYNEWFRSAVADEFAANGGLGLGDKLAEQLDLHDEKSIGPGDELRRRTSNRLRRPPVDGKVSSRFGHRVHPLSGEKSFHRGVDIVVPVGTPIISPYNGEVVEVGSSPKLGKYINIVHGGGFKTLYAHLSKVHVKVGEKLFSGAIVAASGDSGEVTGAHLHFAIFQNGIAQDPQKYIDI